VRTWIEKRGWVCYVVLLTGIVADKCQSPAGNRVATHQPALAPPVRPDTTATAPRADPAIHRTTPTTHRHLATTSTIEAAMNPNLERLKSSPSELESTTSALDDATRPRPIT
jgi:hypothetical protein